MNHLIPFRFLAILFAVACISALSVLADTNSTSDMNGSTNPGANNGLGRGKRSAGKRLNPDSGAKNTNDISGRCTIQEGPSNPIAGPCVDVLLVLTESDGTESAKVRTGKDGSFKFTGDDGKTYSVVPASKTYVIANKQSVIHPGDTISIRLDQK